MKLLKSDSDACSDTYRAFHIYLSPVVLCDMLDDREPKPRAALCTAAAFINSVEALENSWYAFLRYAKPRIGHGKPFVSGIYFYIAVLTVIFYRIIHKVVDKLADLRSAACYDRAFSADSYPYTTALRLL